MEIATKPPVFGFQRGEYVGILGGGQLGRLLVERTHRLGLQTHVLCYKHSDPAAMIATRSTIIDKDWKDTDALRDFATSGVRWILCEWENVPVSAVEFIGQFVQVHTMSEVLGVGRSRAAEKNLAGELGIPTTDWMDATDSVGESALTMEWSKKEGPFILKSDNGGYDGGGQKEFAFWSERKNTYRPGHAPSIIEQKVKLAMECSVVVARDTDGNTVVSPALRNEHTNHYGGGILASTIWYPGCIDEDLEKEAQQYAKRIALQLDLVGVICVEFLITTARKLLFNEMAPVRPHNSAHGTLEAAEGQDQFYWYLASVIPGLQLQSMFFDRPWMMINLIGQDIELISTLHDLGWSVHDYGKSEARSGRKMGHATVVVSNEDELHPVYKVIKELPFETPIRFIW